VDMGIPSAKVPLSPSTRKVTLEKALGEWPMWKISYLGFLLVHYKRIHS
jgi:hypothetical protein